VMAQLGTQPLLVLPALSSGGCIDNQMARL
jgi:hypothetical protein